MRKVGSEVSSKRWGAIALGLFGAALALTPTLAEAGAVPTRQASAKPAATQAALGFVENKGQWDSKARFMGRGQGVTMWLQNGGVVLDYPRPKGSKSRYLGHAVEMRFLGSKGGTLAGAGRNGTVEMLNGKHSGRGGKFARVKNAGVYPGVDFVSYFDGKAPRYDFVVAPGANPQAIRLGFAGAKGVRVVDADTLAIGTIYGEQKLDGLFAYQNVAGKRKPISIRFAKNAKDEVTFSVGAYDKSKPLVIDPLVYGTYFGGNAGFDEVRAMGSDLTGGTYVTGYTLSAQFPRNAGPYGFDLKGGRDAFLSKLQGDAYDNDYSVYIGGADDDQANFLNVDASGNVFIAGTTASADFPGSTAVGAGEGRMWIMRFAPTRVEDPDSNAILTPFRDTDQNGAIESSEAVDANTAIFRFGNDINGDDGVEFLAGLGIPRPEGAAASNVTRIVTGGTSFGVELAAVDALDNSGLSDGEVSTAFYATIEYDKTTGTFSVNQATSGYVVSASSTLQPSYIEMTGVAVDVNGNIYLSGTHAATGSSDTAADADPIFDTTANVFENGRLQLGSDIFIRKLSATGEVIYSALLGGEAEDVTEGRLLTRNVDLASPFLDQIFERAGPTVAADQNGNAYILGQTASIDFPRTRGVVGPVFTGAYSNASITKISATGREILYSTNLGLTGEYWTAGISVDPRGAAYVTGIVTRINVFNAPVGDPPVPNAPGANPGRIPTTPDAIRSTYESTEPPQIKTDDGFLVAINSDATQYLQGTYIGGLLDEGVFAPYTDPFGDTFVFGWTDTFREYYTLPSSGTGNPTRYRVITDMNAFITPGAFKAVSERTSQGLVQVEDNVAYGIGSTGSAALGNSQVTEVPFVINNGDDYSFADYFPPPVFPPQEGVAFLRDGFILRYRLSLPLLQSLTLSPPSIPGGDASRSGTPASSLATLTLSSPAPEGGASITVTLDNGSVASFNPSSSVTSTIVNIAPGETQVQFRVYSSPVQDVTNVQIRADYAGNVRVASLSVRPWLQSLSISTSTNVGGSGDAGPPSTFPTGTVRLEAPAQGDIRVILSSTSPLVRFPNSAGQPLTTGEVIVPNGQQTATFSFQTMATDTTVSARIDATLLNVTRSQNITITPAQLNRIVFNPSSIVGGSTTTGQVFLDGRAATTRRIKVELLGVAADSGYSLGGSSSSNPLVTFVNVQSTSDGPNSNFASFTLTTAYETANVTRTVRAVQVDSNGNEIGNRVTGTVVVLAQNIASVAVDPETVESGGVARVTVALGSPAPAGGVRLRVYSSNQSLFPLSNTTVVPAGQSSLTFTVKAGANLTSAAVPVTITAYRGSETNGTAKTTTVRINPLTYTVTMSPTTVFGGTSAQGRITLSRAQIGGVRFSISAPSGSGVTVSPTLVTIPAGSTTGTFTINTTAVSTTRTVNLKVSTGSQTPKTVGVTVRAVQVSSLSLSRSVIRSGETTRLTVTLDGAPSVDTTIQLTLSNGTLISFPPVVIRAGQTSATVTSRPAARVPRTLTTTISASFGGNTESTTLTVQR